MDASAASGLLIDLVQQINGHTTVDVIDSQQGKAKSEGILALQLHAGPPMTVQFKDIQLKKLGRADAAKEPMKEPLKSGTKTAAKQ